MIVKKFLSFCLLIILASCGAGNQSLVDDFFDVNGENEAETGTLNYSTKEFREAVANDGSIENTITIELVGRTFTGAVGEEYIGSKLNLTNVPSGLTISAQFVNNKEILVSVTGNANDHANVDDVNNITFDFDDSAFNVAKDIAGKQSLVAVNYRDPYALSYDKNIIDESGSNDGQFVDSINVSVNDLTFSGNTGEDFVANGKVTITNAPAGTTGSAVKVGQNIIAISLSGAASSHSSADDISNLTVIFNSPAFPTGVNAGVVANTTRNDLGVNFYDPASLSFLPLNETFAESISNIGAINNQVTIHVTEDTFSGSVGEDYISSGKISVANIPAGLGVTATKATASDLIISLVGTAANHTSSDSVSNLAINFSATAFNFNTNISNVSGAQKADYIVDFIDPYVLSFSTKNFQESGDNDGTISTISTVSVVGTDFTGGVGENFVSTSKVNVANIPNGLVASVVKTSANTATLSFTGNALSHESVNDLSNVTVNFLDAAFISGAALGVNGASNSDISVQFRDPVSLTYSGSTFFESTANDGTISNVIDITLNNDLLTGINGENFISGGKASITPSPVASGLTAELERISNTQLRLKLNGAAVSSNVDISGITLTFDPSAFVTSSSITNINGAIKNNFEIDYIDVLTYSSVIVNERALNDGQIDESVSISLTGTNFTGSNGDNLVADGKVLITNLPAGLSVSIVRNSTQSATLSIGGSANNHASSDNLSNISISFQSTAFISSNASSVTNSIISNFEIRYLDPVNVAYSSSEFVESVANDGSISNTIVLTLTGDTFTGAVSEDFLAGSKVTLSPAVPTGLTATLIRTSSTTLEFSLTGNASVHDVDQGPFLLTLDESAFTVNSDTTNIAGATKSDIFINYNDSITYSTLAFVERAQNDGLVETTSLITLTGTTFTGSNTDDFVTDSKVTVTNLPLGHTVSIIRNSATQLLMSISGAASSHTSAEDVSNLTLSFDNSAFVGNSSASVAGSTVNNMTISYLDPVALAYSTDIFLENSVNDGSISNSIDIDLSNDTFTGSNGEDFVGGKALVTNIPVGLTAQIIRITSTKVRFSLIGNASSSNIDVSNIGVSFDPSAFTLTSDTSNVQNVIRNDIKINYYDILTYSTKNLTERALNDGVVTQTSSISITGTSFSGSNSDDFVAQGKALVSNVPTGLTAVLTRNSSSQLTLSLTGTASNHESADSTPNMTISFLDTALSGSTASTLENATVSDIAVNFFDSVAISYSAGVFNESLSNDGSIGNTITLTAVNDSYTGSNGENFIANGKATIINLPAGLTASLIKQSASVLQFQISGNAIDHGDIHDVNNVSLEIKPSALTTTTNTTNVLNATKSDIEIDYISPSILVYDTLTFTESSANNGTLANGVVVDINGFDTFTGVIGSDLLADGKVTVSNIPVGYSVTVLKTASKQVRFALTGSSISHESSDNVSNIGIAFNSSALTFNNDISLVTDNSQSAISVVYQDAANLTYSATTLSENVANIGGVDTTIDIDLANDTFTGINGENLLGTSKAVISNVPAGLNPSLTRISATKVRLQFTGSASNNTLSDSINNLTLNFQPSAFTFNTDVTTIGNSQRNNLSVNFLDPYQMAYSSSTFSETASNTGAVTGSSSISITGTTFAGNIGDNFVSNGFVTVQNLPAGLTAQVEKTATNQVVFTLIGNATNNAVLNNISNLGLTFQSAAFTSGDSSGVVGSSKSDFVISFIDPYSVVLSGTSFTEDIQNIGTITESITIDLVGHTFSGSNSDDFIVGSKVLVTNVPSGLTARVIRNSATQLELSFTGTASSHLNSDDISNLGFALQDSALTDGALAANVVNGSSSSLSIDFLPPYTLSSNGSSFDEDGANDGSVTDTVTYTLVGTTFSGSDGRDLFAEGHVSLANTPAGLTPVVTKLDDNNVRLSFSGNALNHAVANNSANTNINFLAGAFTSNNENGVTPNVYTGLSFSWDDPPALSYSPTILQESNSNVGATSTSVSIFAANKTFDGALGENFVSSSKVIVTGHPVGLIPAITFASPNQVNLTFSGNATNHDDADDIATGITVSFNDTAFVGGNSSQVVNGTFTNIGMDFIDPYQLNYASTVFNESSLNNGSISNSISITVSGTLFTGSVSEEYVGASKAIVRNVPAGLTATVTKLSTSLVEVTLNGNASAHEAANNISNLEVELLDTAFASGAAAGVNDSVRSDIAIAFNDTASVIYGGSSLAEATTNIGNIGNTITISVDKDTFTGPNGENFISTAKVSASNVPVGLVPQVVKTSDTTLDFTLTGSAVAHENIHDVSNVTLSFAGSAFSFNSNPAAINNSSKSDFNVDYIDAYQLSYVSSTFDEAATNDGSIGNTITINLVGTTFSGTNSDDFVTDSKATVSNLPAGLTPVITRTSSTSLTVSLSGNATSHANSNDLSSVGIIFADSAFTSGKSAGVQGYSKNDIVVDFDDPPYLTYVTGVFNEAVSNIGAITSTVDITLTNTTFSGSDSDIYTNGNQITFSNIPAGLSAQAQRIDATTVRVSLLGNASSHGSTDSIATMGIQFNDSAFSSVLSANINDNSKSDYAVNFINPYSISYSGNTFSETATNVGAIATSVDISVVGTTFTGANGSVYTNGVDATYLNIPSGLSPRLEKINNTTVRLTFSGNASLHAVVNNSTSFGISLQDSIFTSGAAAGVSNNTKIDFNINYIDPYTISYSLPGFQESASNNGSVGTTVDIDISGTTFSGVNGSNYTLSNQYTINNLPAGLTAVLFKVSNTKLRLFFTGSASLHEDVNDVTNFTVALTNTAFTTGAAAGVLNNSKSDFLIDFIDGATLAYSGALLSESTANIGAVDNTITITLANDTFSGLNGENYVSNSKVVVSNIPAGLLASVTKISDTSVGLTLTGNANSHLDTDDISNLTVTFNASAFSFNSDATTVTNYSKNDILVDFMNQYELAYAPGVFSEAALNDGSIGNSVVISATGTNFTTTGSDFIAEGKVSVTNIPSGLSASIVRDSATQMTLSLTGNASNNLNSNDISNLTVTYADSAFTTGAAAGVNNAVKGDLQVDFEDQPAIIFASSTFNESASNVGATLDAVNINLSGATFTGNNGDVYTSGNQFSVSNVPAGLVANVQRITANQLRLTFTGAATSHEASDNIANMGLTLTDSAFNVITASNVTNNSKSDFVVTFRDPYSLTYSSNVFTESNSNIGAVSTTININVSGTTFTGTNSSIYSNGVEYSFTNLPSGLGVQVQKISSTQLALTLTGAASSNDFSDSITNFTLSLLNGAFTSGAAAGVNDTTKSDFNINFVDPYTIAFSGAVFNEDGVNDGSISNFIDLTLTGTSFTGTNGANYTLSSQYTVANVPAGLSVVVNKLNSTTLRVSLSGQATSNDDSDGVTDLTVSLLDSAFVSGAAAGVAPSSKTDFVIDFTDNATLAYSSTTFNEDVSNIGAIANTISVTLTNDTFTGTNGDNFVSSSKVAVTNLPAGLTATVNRTSDTTLDIILLGQASSNLSSDNITNLSVVFSASAFSFNTDASTISNSSRSDIGVDFLDQYSIAYAPTTFSESAANDGSVDTVLVATLTGSTFTTTGTDFISEGKVSITNVPSGLVAVATRVSSIQMNFTLTSNASNHASSNDISNLTIAFADTAFVTGAAAGVNDSSISNLNVDFNDPPNLTYASSIFTESEDNVGTVATTIDVTLTDATFSGVDGAFYIAANQFNVTNTPAGLTLTVQKIDSTTVRLGLSGTASNHAVLNSIANLGIQFTDNAFNTVSSSNVLNNSKSDFAINFRDPYTLAYSGSAFDESVANTGAILNTVNINVSGTTFTGANAANYTNGVEYSYSNLPAGLGVQVQKVSDTQLQLSFTSSATSHVSSDSIIDFTLNLLDGAFVSGAAAGVSDTTKADFAINFIDPYTIAYTSSSFNEAGTNDGSILETIDLDITGTSFTGSNGGTYTLSSEYTVSNVPSGLTVVVTKINSTKLRLSFSGSASVHTSAASISNMGVVLTDAAFSSGSSAGVTDSSKNDYVITFVDNASIAYSTGTFSEEVSNVGSIGSSITLTLTSDVFTGLNGENYLATGKATLSNLPGGLTAQLLKASDTTLTLTLGANASSHVNTDDISNLELVLAATAFDFNTDATAVSNYSKSDLNIDFLDPYLLSYDTSLFTESNANNGSIGNSITITLSGGAGFTTTASDFITEGKVAISNVPAGLSAAIVRDSATQLTFSLSGSATSNANVNDISNIRVNFADTAFDTGVRLGVTNYDVTTVAVDFNDQPSLTYSISSVTEDTSNVGEFTSTIDITLANDTFTGTNSDVYTGAKVSFANAPSGLTPSVQKISDSLVRLSFSSNASAHEIVNNIADFTVNFQNAAFTNVAAANIDNSSKSDININFRDPYLVSYSTSNFSEALTNDGAITSTVDVTLTGTTFSGSNGAIYANGNQYNQSNNPTGLNLAVQKINGTTLRISLSGNAASHANIDDISNLGIDLLNAAFTSANAAGVNNSSKLDFTVDFNDPATLTYSSVAIQESNLNNGTISQTIDIDIIGDTFTGLVNSDLIDNGDITVNNIPAGLTAVANKISSTKLTISFSGSATSHVSADDIANFGFTFLDSAFTNNTAASNVTNYSRSDITFSFEDPYVLSYSSLSFEENGANNGSITDSILINLAGTTFTGANGSDFAGTKAVFSNTPVGLTPVVLKNNNNQVELSFSGSASAHANAQDISNFTITFQDSAFDSGAASGVDNSNVSTITIDFKDIASIAYSSSVLNESVANTGSITESLTLTLSGDDFNGSNGDNFIANSFASINNLPAGLLASLVKTSATTATLSFTGSASSHVNANDIANLEIIFSASAFAFNSNASIVTNSTKSDINIDFNDPYTIAYSATSFTEAASNNGSISQTETITLTGTSFTGTNGDNFVGAKAGVSNVPVGLTPVLTRISATVLELSFIGAATNNENSHDVSNVTIIFADTAFLSGAASGVTGFSRNDIAIDFNDRPVLTYNSNAFFEAISNIGNIDTSIIITIASDTFSSGVFNASKVNVSNLPAGLGVTFIRDSATQLTMNLTGTATGHANVDDISNLGVAFLDAAFTNVTAANITNSSKSDISVNFIDPYSLAYSGGNFSESLSNNGVIGNTISINSSGVSFNTPIVNMILDGMVSVSNVPAGLTAVVTKNSASQVTFSLSGTASSHVNSDDIANLEIIFNDSAFSSGESDGVLNNTKSNFVVDFQDPASLAYSTATFTESVANNGVISNMIDIDLSGDTFTGSNGDNFIGTKITASNVPAGLTAVLTRISSTKIRVSLTGTASAHENVNDVTNLTLAFLDAAFTNNSAASNVINNSRSDIEIDFQNRAVIAYSATTFTESVGNNGTISNTLALTLTGDTFEGSNGENFVTTSKVVVTNVPAGLTVVANKTSNTVITLSLTGTAASHVSADDVANLSVVFADTAFSNNATAANVTGASRADLTVDFEDPANLSYATNILNEDPSNDGNISSSLVITLGGDTFTGSNGENYVGNSKVAVSNVPSGMTLTAVRDSSSQVTISLTGSASSHANADDVSNLTITFANSAFTNNSVAANIINYDRSDLQINFNDPAVIAYGGGTFEEVLLNNGAIDNSISITISGDNFSGSNGENFVSAAKVSVTNLPSGLSANLTRMSDTQLSFSLTGNAASHVNLNDIANLTLTFNASAFVGNAVATNVVNYQKNDFAVNFNDPYAIVYSLATFVENPATDDGSIEAPINISVEGTTFTGLNGDNFVGSKVTVTNVPAGLTARMIRVSETQLAFNLDGNASPHNDTADVSNITVVFQDSAFAINNAGLVATASKNDITADFYVTPVNAPSDLLVTDSSANSLTVTWVDNANNEARFIVERCDGEACDTTWSTDFTQTISTPDTVTYTYTGLSEGSYYRLRVRAENDDVASPWVTSELQVVFASGSISDNGQGVSAEYRAMSCWMHEGTYAVITWTDIGANNYVVYDETSGSAVIDTLPSGTSSYLIRNQDFNTAKSYRVVANMDNGVVSPNSTTVNITTSADFAPCNVIGNNAGTVHGTKPTALWTPTAIHRAVDGANEYFLVGDYNNSRVLIYDSYPTSKDAIPSVVLGQNRVFDSSSNVVGITNIQRNSGTNPPVLNVNDLSPNMIQCPEGVWAGDINGSFKVMVSDVCSHRILVWNGMPTEDNAIPDQVIGKNNFESTNCNLPTTSTGVCSPRKPSWDGTYLVIPDWTNNRVIIHNGFPSGNGNTAWDVCLGANDCSSNKGVSATSSTFNRPMVAVTANIGGTKKLLVGDWNNHRIMVWNDISTVTHTTPADFVLGQANFTSSGASHAATGEYYPSDIHYDEVNDRLYVSSYGSCKIRVYNNFSTVTTNQPSADYSIGYSNTTASCSFHPERFHNIRSMMVDVANDRIAVANQSQNTIDFMSPIPTGSSVSSPGTFTKDFQIGTHDPYKGNANYGSDDLDGRKNRYAGVDYDPTTKQFFATDTQCDRVLVWNSVPKDVNQQPDFVLGNSTMTSCEGAGVSSTRLYDPHGMCVSPGVVWVADYINNRLVGWDLPISANNAPADYVVGQTSFTTRTQSGSHYPGRPLDCHYDSVADKLLVASWGYHNITIYDDGAQLHNSSTLTDHRADHIIGYFNTSSPVDASHIANPRHVIADGTHVYVADWSRERVLIFPYPTSDHPAATGVLGQINLTSESYITGPSAVRRPSGLFIANGRLYTADRDFNRIMYFTLPVVSVMGPVASGLYGQAGDYEFSNRYATEELQEADFTAIATDNKRIFSVDNESGKIIITPIREAP